MDVAQDLRRERVARIALAFPQATQSSRTGQHTAFEVRGKKFAYYLVDHHGDGRVAINCKVAPGAQAALIASDSKRYFAPAYLGPKGWIGVDLDAFEDWGQIEAFLRDSYRLIAPKSLAQMV